MAHDDYNMVGAQLSDYYANGLAWYTIVSVMGYGYHYNSNGTITHGDGISLTSLVLPSAIPGNWGLTIVKYDSSCSWWFSTQNIIEADVMMNNTLAFGPEDESFYGVTQQQQGRTFMLHEMGHALGLAHSDSSSDGFNVMRALGVQPLSGQNSTEPFPDDVAGVRFLYPGAVNYQSNVLASAQTMSGGQVVDNQPSGGYTALTKCPGQQIVIPYTIVNNGLTNLTVMVYLFLSNGYDHWNREGTSAIAKWFSVTLNAGQWSSSSYTVSVPPLPPGQYWVYASINPTCIQNGPEWSCTDNSVHVDMTVTIPTGC